MLGTSRWVKFSSAFGVVSSPALDSLREQATTWLLCLWGISGGWLCWEWAGEPAALGYEGVSERRGLAPGITSMSHDTPSRPGGEPKREPCITVEGVWLISLGRGENNELGNKPCLFLTLPLPPQLKPLQQQMIACRSRSTHREAHSPQVPLFPKLYCFPGRA